MHKQWLQQLCSYIWGYSSLQCSYTGVKRVSLLILSGEYFFIVCNGWRTHTLPYITFPKENTRQALKLHPLIQFLFSIFAINKFDVYVSRHFLKSQFPLQKDEEAQQTEQHNVYSWWLRGRACTYWLRINDVKVYLYPRMEIIFIATDQLLDVVVAFVFCFKVSFASFLHLLILPVTHFLFKASNNYPPMPYGTHEKAEWSPWRGYVDHKDSMCRVNTTAWENIAVCIGHSTALDLWQIGIVCSYKTNINTYFQW